MALMGMRQCKICMKWVEKKRVRKSLGFFGPNTKSYICETCLEIAWADMEADSYLHEKNN